MKLLEFLNQFEVLDLPKKESFYVKNPLTHAHERITYVPSFSEQFRIREPLIITIKK